MSLWLLLALVALVKLVIASLMVWIPMRSDSAMNVFEDRVAPSPSLTLAKTKGAARLCLGPQPSRIRGSPALTGRAAVRTALPASPPLRACASLHVASWRARLRGTDASRAANKARRRQQSSTVLRSGVALGAQRLRLRCRRAALVFARRLRLRAACSCAVLRLPRPSPIGATLRASRKIRNAIPPNSTMQTMPTGMTTPVEMVLECRTRSCGRRCCGAFFFAAALLVKFEDDSEGAPKAPLEDGVSAPAAAGF